MKPIDSASPSTPSIAFPNCKGSVDTRRRNSGITRSLAEPTLTNMVSTALRLPDGDGSSNNQLDSSEKTGGHPVMSILERVVGLSKPRSRKQILACLLLPALLSPASAQELPANQDLSVPAQAAPLQAPQQTPEQLQQLVAPIALYP